MSNDSTRGTKPQKSSVANIAARRASPSESRRERSELCEHAPQRAALHSGINSEHVGFALSQAEQPTYRELERFVKRPQLRSLEVLKPGAFVIGLSLLLVTLAPSRAWANEDDAINRAYEKAKEGLVEYNSGQFALALERFTVAFSIVKLPALAVHMARANVKLGRFVTAAELYREALRLGDGIGAPEVQARARSEAQNELEALLPRLSKIRIRISLADASKVTLAVDGTPVLPQSYESGVIVDPGRHHIVANYGREKQEQLATLGEGESKEVQLTFADQSIALRETGKTSEVEHGSNSTLKTFTWVSLGVGGTGLLVSGVAGLVALSQQHRANDTGCNHQPYRASTCDETAMSRYGTFRTVAGVGFYTGLVGVVTGSVLYFGAPHQKKTRDAKLHMLPWVGIESAGIEGTF